MRVEKVLETIEQVLLSRQLSAVERMILRQSWCGQTYSDMTRESAYGSPHLKEVGSRLWHELSVAVGERVTKKNLHLVFGEYLQKQDPNFSHSSHNRQPLTNIEELAELPTFAIAQTKIPDDTQGRHTLLRYQNKRAVAPIPSLPSQEQPKENIRAIPFPGAPVPLNSSLYVKRPPIEELTFREISQPGCTIRIKGPTRMGKSSLLNRIIARAVALEYKTVYLNFQEADKSIFSDLDRFLRWFASNVSQQLHLNPCLDSYWDEDIGGKVSCKIYFQEYLLQHITNPIVLAIDELHRLFEYPEIAQEFLPMLRFWHELAQRLVVWQKLRLVIAHATEFYIPLKLNQSPFNIGLAIQVPTFNLQQVQGLALGYGLDWASGSEGIERLRPLVSMVGGHPYLVNLAFYHLHQGEMTLEELLGDAHTPSGIYSNHLRSYLALLRDDPQLIPTMQQILTNENVVIDAITAYKLESMGAIKLEGNQAKLSCQLYHLYFQQQLL